MFGRGHREGHDVTDGLVEAGVGAVAEGDGLVLVLQEVLHMAHLVVHCDEVIHVHHCALLDPGQWEQELREVTGQGGVG